MFSQLPRMFADSGGCSLSYQTLEGQTQSDFVVAEDYQPKIGNLLELQLSVNFHFCKF